VPIVLIGGGATLINQHPEPVDDCPCFEDSIAFVAVVIGTGLGRWHSANYGLDAASGFLVVPMPGSQLATFEDWLIYLFFCTAKMVVGVMIIFAWRIVAKTVMLTALPPIYRFVSTIVTLPHRRFYTPATEYKSVPQEDGLNPIPSVIDLPSTVESTNNRSLHPSLANGSVAKQRLLSPGKEREQKESAEEEVVYDRTEPVTHYDASVITKVVVYCGIGWLAAEWVPALFEVLGWGVLALPPR